MNKIFYWISVAAFIVIVTIGVALAFQDIRDKPKSDTERTWVVYEADFQKKVNRDAVIAILMDKGATGIDMSKENVFEIQLGHRDESLSRTALLKIAKETGASLPDGHPYEITVQTLSNAVRQDLRWIQKLQRELDTMKRINKD